MKFEEIIPALREGKKARKKFWSKGHYTVIRKDGVMVFENGAPACIAICNLNEDVWEIVKEPKKVKLRDLTYEQFAKWKEHNCKKLACGKNCTFYSVNCGCGETKEDGRFGWIFNKDLYSGKFLDQEIEIEVDDD